VPCPLDHSQEMPMEIQLSEVLQIVTLVAFRGWKP
jgi:hypothetical protein